MRSKTIRVCGIKVKYDLPKRKGRFSIWREQHGSDVWFILILVPGLCLYGWVCFRLFFR